MSTTFRVGLLKCSFKWALVQNMIYYRNPITRDYRDSFSYLVKVSKNRVSNSEMAYTNRSSRLNSCNSKDVNEFYQRFLTFGNTYTRCIRLLLMFYAAITIFDLTFARDSISRVSHMTRAVEWSFGVGTVGVSMTVVCISGTFVDIYEIRNS